MNDKTARALVVEDEAAKFSPAHGTVEVSVACYAGSVRVAVTDHGSGIPEDFRAQVFQPFAQATILYFDLPEWHEGMGAGGRTIMRGLARDA